MAVAKKKPEGKKKRTRQQRRVSVTRHKLLDAARTVFSEKGFDMATIKDITERADLGKGTFYNHFKSKTAVVRELVKSILEELIDTLETKCSDISGLENLLDTIISVHIEFFANRWEDFVLYFQGRADLTIQEGYEGIETPFLHYIEAMEGLLDQAIKIHLTKAITRQIACAVAGFLSGYYSITVVTTDVADIDELFRSLRGALVASLSRFIKEAVQLTDGDNSK